MVNQVWDSASLPTSVHRDFLIATFSVTLSLTKSAPFKASAKSKVGLIRWRISGTCDSVSVPPRTSCRRIFCMVRMAESKAACFRSKMETVNPEMADWSATRDPSVPAPRMQIL